VIAAILSVLLLVSGIVTASPNCTPELKMPCTPTDPEVKADILRSAQLGINYDKDLVKATGEKKNLENELATAVTEKRENGVDILSEDQISEKLHRIDQLEKAIEENKRLATNYLTKAMKTAIEAYHVNLVKMFMPDKTIARGVARGAPPVARFFQRLCANPNGNHLGSDGHHAIDNLLKYEDGRNAIRRYAPPTDPGGCFEALVRQLPVQDPPAPGEVRYFVDLAPFIAAARNHRPPPPQVQHAPSGSDRRDAPNDGAPQKSDDEEWEWIPGIGWTHTVKPGR